MALDTSDGESTAVRLRELLKVKEEDELSGRTLAAAFHSDKPHVSSQMNQTLLEIFREENARNTTENNHGKKGWKSFKECLRLGREGVGWMSVPIPASDIPIRNTRAHLSRGRSSRHLAIGNGSTETPAASDSSTTRTGNPNLGRAGTPSFSRMSSTRMPRVTFNVDEPDEGLSTRADQQGRGEDETVEDDGSVADGGTVEGPVRMSLIDLLQETDRQMGVAGTAYCGYAEDELEEEEDEREMSSGKMEEHTCCVCMVRHRGAAFIPCGHTFCRLCSRELWVSRGNCPTCNGFILEILDIF